MMSYLVDKYEAFYEYFMKQYVPHVDEWVTCHRVATIVNTNMFTESFHRILKVVYLNNKIDRLLHVPLALHAT